jgi:hypothetical protein
MEGTHWCTYFHGKKHIAQYHTVTAETHCQANMQQNIKNTLLMWGREAYLPMSCLAGQDNYMPLLHPRSLHHGPSTTETTESGYLVTTVRSPAS